MKNANLRKNYERGITLIALVITIIVLLILAGVTIATLTGDNGVLTKANEAKIANDVGTEKEQIELAYNAARIDALTKGDGAVTATNLKDELIANGVTGANVTGTGTLEVTMPSGNVYTIDSNGGITELEPIDWDAIIADANASPEKYKHPQQESSEYIGIGTDGKAVNMDLWVCQYSFAGNTGGGAYPENGYALFNGFSSEGMWYVRNRAYLGDNFDNIIIPQYIKGKSDAEFIPVTSLTSTFFMCTELITAPELPSTVKYLDSDDNGRGTFYRMYKLKNSAGYPVGCD